MVTTVAAAVAMLLLATTQQQEDWLSVTRGVYINYDLEEHPLQIKTDSAAGSRERIEVTLYTAEEEEISNIVLFYAVPRYEIGNCNLYNTYAVDLPAEQDKIWTITKTATALVITCNGVELVNYLYSESRWPLACVTKLSQDVAKIKFHSDHDTASDEYRQEPTEWTSVTRDTRIPYDLQDNPLQIKTDSAVGSYDRVFFYAAAGDDYISYIVLGFYDPPKYYIYPCTSSSFTNFPDNLPEEQDKIWTITKTTTALKIECNGVLVVDYVYSEAYYADECVAAYSQDVEMIWFSPRDTASDQYREKPTDPYECHDWTTEDEAWRDEYNATDEEICSDINGYVYTSGDDSLAPGCGGCWCCKPTSDNIVAASTQT